MHIKHYVQYLLSKKLTAAYTNNILKCLRAYFRFAIHEEYIYSNGFDIALVQRLLQHSSASTTQRYIGIEPQRIEQAIQNHANLI